MLAEIGIWCLVLGRFFFCFFNTEVNNPLMARAISNILTYEPRTNNIGVWDATFIRWGIEQLIGYTRRDIGSTCFRDTHENNIRVFW